MGIFRLILAMLVAAAHLGVLTQLNDFGILTAHAIFAVRAFFVISGFLMAKVLTERYAKHTARFYLARTLRLLPIYWAVCIVVVALDLALTPAGARFSPIFDPVGSWRTLHMASFPIGALGYIVVSLTTLVGMDSTLWLGLDPLSGTFSIAPLYAPGATSVLALSPIPQTWTIGLEITFYALAPLIVRRSWRLIAGLAAASIALRFLAGVDSYPWDRALFPTEFVFFLLGVLAYQAGTVAVPAPRAAQRVIVAAGAALLVAIRATAIATGEHFTLDLLGAAIVACALPCLYSLAARSRADRRLGDLSYPLYLVHFGVFAALPRIFPSAVIDWPWFGANLLAALLASAAVDYAVARPVERLRSMVVRGRGARSSPVVGTPKTASFSATAANTMTLSNVPD